MILVVMVVVVVVKADKFRNIIGQQ